MKCYLCYIGLLMVVEQNKFDRFYPNTQGKMASLWIYTSAFMQIHESVSFYRKFCLDCVLEIH